MFDNLEELRNNNWKESIETKDSPVSEILEVFVSIIVLEPDEIM